MRLTTTVLGLLMSVGSLAPVATGLGQETDGIPVGSEVEWTTFAKAYIEIGEISAALQAALALPQNKSEEAQTRVRESMRQEIHDVLQAHGLSETRYSELNFEISTNQDRRDAFAQRIDELRAAEDSRRDR